MATIGLSEDSEIPVLILRELSVERLYQLPHVRSSGDSGCDWVRSVGKSNSDGLVHVQHICVFIEAIRV